MRQSASTRDTLAQFKASMNASSVDEAASNIENVARDYLHQAGELRSNLDLAISVLSSPDCPTRPPHPKTLELIRLRNALPGKKYSLLDK